MLNQKSLQLKLLLKRLIKLTDYSSLNSDGLSNGRSGVALTYILYSNYFENWDYGRKGLGLIEEIINNLYSSNSILNSMHLYSGLTGFLSILNNLNQSGMIEIDMDEFSTLDSLLHEWSLNEVKKGNFDFLLGPVGSINYFSNRLPNQRSNDFLESLLREIFVNGKNESFIFGLRNTYYNKLNKKAEDEINYGLAHGMSSLLIILLNLVANNENFSWVDEFIKDFVKQLVDANIEYNHKFPTYFIGSIQQKSKNITFQKRLGWCYSDLNLIHLLIEYQKCYSTFEYDNIINSATGNLINRVSYSNTLVKDPYLCHGSFGIALYFKKLYKYTNDERFDKAKDYWIDKGLEFYQKTNDSFFFSEQFKKKGSVNSFFYGPLGNILCIISLLDDNLPNWSQIILL